jgi:hypothetical protein
MEGMIMAPPPPLLPIEESTGKKKENILRIVSTTTVVINCICSAQTNTNAAGRGKWARGCRRRRY